MLTVFANAEMGRTLALTFVCFLVVNLCLAYRNQLLTPAGADFMTVFRFVATAGLTTFLAASVQHATWFHNCIVGHIIEPVFYSAIVAGIFGAMWPAAQHFVLRRLDFS